MSKTKKTITNTGKEKAESEYLKQLEYENLRLRIENAYLKELRRLRSVSYTHLQYYRHL